MEINIEELKRNREKNDQALDMFIERRDITGMPVELFWDWLEELRKFRKAESEAELNENNR